MRVVLGKTLLLCVLACPLFCLAQRTYKPSSVLAAGNWFKISVGDEGIYKVDVAFLNSLGITGSIPSAQIRLLGNGGGMLPESNSEKPADDLEENAIWINDGGDGTLNGTDYFLFYAQGPHHWQKDSANKRFTHQKNLYSEKSFYYISVGGNGLRIATQTNASTASTTVTSFDERYFHELDTVNFLASGKEWYGEEFSSAPGRVLNRSFTLPFNNISSNQATIITKVAARSVNQPSRFNVSVNGAPLQQIDIPQISAVIYDLFAQESQRTDVSFLNQSSATIAFNYVPGSFNSQGWLNWFEFFCRRNLSMAIGMGRLRGSKARNSTTPCTTTR